MDTWPLPVCVLTVTTKRGRKVGGYFLKVFCVSVGKSTPSSETSERAQSAKRDGLSSGEKNSSESKATQVQARVPTLGPARGQSVEMDDSDWFLFFPCRTWRRRPRPVRRVNWSPRLRTLRRVRYFGLISFPSFKGQRQNGRLSLLPPSLPFPHSSPPVWPDTPPPQRENGYYLYPPVLPSTSPHFSLMPREALTPRSCNPLGDQGRRQTDLHL